MLSSLFLFCFSQDHKRQFAMKRRLSFWKLYHFQADVWYQGEENQFNVGALQIELQISGIFEQRLNASLTIKMKIMTHQNPTVHRRMMSSTTRYLPHLYSFGTYNRNISIARKFTGTCSTFSYFDCIEIWKFSDFPLIPLRVCICKMLALEIGPVNVIDDNRTSFCVEHYLRNISGRRRRSYFTSNFNEIWYEMRDFTIEIILFSHQKSHSIVCR